LVLTVLPIGFFNLPELDADWVCSKRSLAALIESADFPENDVAGACAGAFYR
jgi:hypothetical protein